MKTLPYDIWTTETYCLQGNLYSVRKRAAVMPHKYIWFGFVPTDLTNMNKNIFQKPQLFMYIHLRLLKVEVFLKRKGKTIKYRVQVASLGL